MPSGAPGWSRASPTRRSAPSSSRRATTIRRRCSISRETLIRRRDIIARTWLNGVNPIVDVSLDSTGSLRFTNAAVAAGVAAHGTYTIAWARFDNESGSSSPVSVEKQTQPRGTAPRVVALERRFHRGDDLERAGGSSSLGVAGPSLLPPRGRRVEDGGTRTNDRLRPPGVNVSSAELPSPVLVVHQHSPRNAEGESYPEADDGADDHAVPATAHAVDVVERHRLLVEPQRSSMKLRPLSIHRSVNRRLYEGVAHSKKWQSRATDMKRPEQTR